MRALAPSSDSISEEQSETANSFSTKDDTTKRHRARPDTPSHAGTPPPSQNAGQTSPAELMRRESLTPKAQPSRPKGDIDADLADESGAELSDNSTDKQEGEYGNDGVAGWRRDGRARATSEELRLERLREAVLLSQQRARYPVGATPQQAQQHPGSLAQRRISPIKEEGLSPTLDEAFASPMTGVQTTSTESTESARTVKGSVPPTPGAGALRTPSYPFPYVPGTPRQWSSGFHRPFTTLSPTVSAQNIRDLTVPREIAMSSGASTPIASASAFMPGTARGEDEVGLSEAYPSPNLYDLVLALNSEPGLEAWWAVVVNTVRDWYGAERATLAIPADASELETVPWGQKATYDQLAPTSAHVPPAEDRKPSAQPDRPLRSVQEPEKPTQKSSLSARPKLTARHSYAGFERDRNAPTTPLEAPSSARSERPRGLSRTLSHAPMASSKIERASWQPPSNEPRPHPLQQLMSIGSASDQEFSSVAETHEAGPYEAVFPTLRALDVEANPLLDSAGVIRVLERGRLVTLTRDYAISSSSRGPSTEPTDSESDNPKKNTKPRVSDSAKFTARPPKAVRAQSDYFSRSKLKTTYEEYEQFPASPWAQSPAPSPAIQTDSEDNPFFTSPRVDEDSFNPKTTPTDYAKAGQVPAIGVDKASTIIHVPLIHPTLSQVLPPLTTEKSDEKTFYERGASTAGRKSDPGYSSSKDERRAPIAVISFLAQTVPYPQNLIQSLKLLAPHLATTFANANQYTNALKQAANIRHRRLLSNPRVGLAITPGEPESLEDLLRLDIDDINASVSGSITSPSDYSAHSRFSPGGSMQGTPGLDAGNSSGFSRASVTHTPAYIPSLESADNYFDAKKRSSLSSKGSSGGNVSSPRASHGNAANTSPDLRKRPGQPATAESSETISYKVAVPTDKTKSTTGETQRRRSSSPASHSIDWPSGSQKISIAKAFQAHQVDRRQHTQLHSFGADFKTSFSTLPATTTPSAAPPSDYLGHVSSNSLEVHDMLPPSEKLLRIIIDALPVQVFMATPSDGSITWANSKYLAYRGQDSRQIMQDPWHTIHADDLHEYMDLWKRSLRTGVQLSHKVRLQRFDGQYRWFFVKIAPLKDKRQNIVHWVGTNMDFHEQHIAETNAARQQETAASEAKYRALANSSPQIVFAATKSKGVTFCNSQWTNYSGQTEEMARGVGFMDHVHPEDLEKCRLPSFKEDGTPVEVPVSLHAHTRTNTGSTRETSSSDDSSDNQTVTSPSTDETAHQDAVHQLPQAKLSKLATTGILKVVRDADGRPSYSTEVRLRNKEGKYRWHLVRVLRSELKDSDEEDQTWYGTCTDINDHKLLEQTLKETMDAKSRFLSNMSHEIRTPLNGITGMVNFLIDSNLTAEQMEHVNIIRNSTEGLRDLINDILDLSKVEAGMITLNMDWLHVRSLIEEVNDLTSALAIDKGLELNYIVEENVPPMVKGDRFRIRQVLLNVIGNAIKFTQRGEVFVRCQRVEAETTQLGPFDALVQFEVIDTGSGFTEKEAEYLFKRFSQIDGSSTRQHGGTGLGLAISMQLVELHGGRMKASSVPNKGSTFTFSIKFGLPSDGDQPPQLAATHGHSALPTPMPLTPAPQSPLVTPSAVPQNLARQIAARSKEGSESPGISISPGNDRRSSVSSAGSVPSLTNVSSRSERSSQSSFVPDPSQIPPQPPMKLQLPVIDRSESLKLTGRMTGSINDTDSIVKQSPMFTPVAAPSEQPSMISIMVVCPLRWSREATLKHIEMTLPKTTPRNITSHENIQDGLAVLKGEDAPIFTQVVLFLQEADQVVPFMDVLFKADNATAATPNTTTGRSQASPMLVIICDLSQRREIMQRAQRYDYEGLQRDRRLRFVFKPLKPSKLAVIFDPQKEREVSSDRMLEGAQAIAVSQKQVFDEMKRRLGSKGAKVLLVEDNRTNQMVLLKFLKRADVQAEAVMDGAQCTDKVFGNPYGTYSIILCDLHMPNKDGYQTCKEIRKWERKNRYPHLPIIALSANVLGDVFAKCVEAGFNGYVTKPVDFKVLSEVMMTFLDPAEPGKPHPFMKMRDEANFGGRR